uniref:gamma-butyrobetaine dioxygenase n=1 Tax=Neogobius melanostomus TaxID=47308 RepID=A0A8C6T1M4_9GOBI
MWMSRCARFVLPALRRSPPVLSVRSSRACGRPSLLSRPQRCGHHTLGSASLPEPGRSVRFVGALREERLLQVEWEDGGHSLYPFTWLRDNCQCPTCTLQSAQARKLLIGDLDVNVGLGSVELTADNKVSITWQDQHSSVFDCDWLKRRCFSAAARRAVQEELFLNERLHWDSSLRVPTAHFQEVLEDDEAALAWLLALRRVGLVLLQGAPAQPGQVARLAERIGYLRLTFYGHTFKVQDKPMANNVAYTADKCSFHTDYPALDYPPGVQFLHCISQAARGGENLLVDGFHIVDRLKAEDPQAFHSLSSLSIDFTDTGTDYCAFRLQAKHRVIDVNAEGNVTRINLNNATRDSVLDLPLEQVQPFYRALRALEDMMNREENMATLRMEPGDIMTFDNWRLLHARTAFVSHLDRPRFLEGCYLDWDEVMSRLRILRHKLQRDEA